MKRILFLGDSGSIHLKQWTNWFVDGGYETHISSFATTNITRCGEFHPLSNHHVKVEGMNLHYLTRIGALAKIIRAVNPDYINAHFSYSYGFLGIVACRLARAKSLFSIVCHGTDILNPPLPLICNKLNWFALRRAHKIVCVSDTIADMLLGKGIPSTKLCIRQYGISLSPPSDGMEKTIDIISTRAFMQNSQIPSILRVLKDFSDRNTKITIVLSNISVGDFDSMKATYPKMTFLKNIDNATMRDLLARSRIYVSATKSDGTSLSLLEALAEGTFPVVSNIPANRSWIVDGINGSLFNDFTGMRIALEEALAHTSRHLLEVSAWNRRMIERRGKYTANMPILEKFITERLPE